MRPQFSDMLQRLRGATQPEDVFGPLADGPEAALAARYRELAAIVHPDHNRDRVDEATAAFQSLQCWYAEARGRVAQGSYGRAPSIHARTARHSYTGYAPPLAGDLCDLFPVEVTGERMLLKVAHRSSNNDLLGNEVRSLRRLDRELDGRPLRAHFPTLVETFLLKDAAGDERQVNVLRAEADMFSLEDILRAYPAGIHPADAAWMFNRVLAALGVAHDLEIVHGAVTPAHVMVRPADHNGMLVDWCYSTAPGQALAALSPAYARDYPPEVRRREPATAATDLYMAARCMLRLLGGDPASAELPPTVPKPIGALLRACLLPAPRRRTTDAWQVFDDFQEILHRCYGPRTWRPFNLPVPVVGSHGAQS